MNIRLLVLINIIFTLCLITLGGYVHNTGASLACPDWPLCYGQVMPVMKGGVLIEHSHRMLGSLVGFVSILILFFSRKQFGKKSRVVKFAWVALAMVIVQGLLGGLTVIFKLPTLVSTSHLGLSMIYLSTLVYIHHLVGIEKKDFKKPAKLNNWNSNLRHYFLLGTVLVYLQIVLGALMRHLGLGGACGVGFENSVKCMDAIDFVKAWIPTSSEAQLHMLHRYTAFAVLAFIIFIFVKAFSAVIKNRKSHEILSKTSKNIWAILLTVIVQVKLGILVVAKNIPANITTLHLLGAALCLILMWKIFLNLNVFATVNDDPKDTIVTDFLSLTKPRLSGLVIFTAAIGMYMNPGSITFFKGMVGLVTTSLIVAGACVLNCYSEREDDKAMNRTKNRPLPSGRISERSALIFGLTLLVSCISIQFIFINFLTGLLGLIATVVYLFMYTPMKKRSWLAVFVGAIPGAIPPLMGWTSVSETFGLMPWVLFGILFVWQLPHFLSISIYYAEDYKDAQFVVLPNLKGVPYTMGQIAFYTLILAIISLMPAFAGYGALYMKLATVFGAIFLICSILGVVNAKQTGVSRGWARKYFWGSLMYLPAILTLIVVYK
jgi:protoheme IX farnesyltransferase